MVGTGINEYIAASQLRNTNSTGFMHNFQTIWNGIYISFVYNSVTQSIETVNYSQDLDTVDLDFLLWLVGGYFGDI